MLRLPTSNNNPTHKTISNRHSQRCTQSLGHQCLVSSCPDKRDQDADGDVANAPNLHERETELLCQRFSRDGEFEALEMVIWAKGGVETEADYHKA